MFAWLRSDGNDDRVQTRTRSADGTLSAVQNLSTAGQDALDPQVAVDADCDAVFTWRRYDGTQYRVQTRTRSAHGTLSALQNLSPAGGIGIDPQVAVDADCDAVFAWRRYDLTHERIQTRTRSAHGALSAVQNLSLQLDYAEDPRVAVDADGDAVFTWWNGRIQARARSAHGTLSAVQTLSAANEVDNPRVAVDADGDAVFTWRIYDGTVYRIQTRTRSADGTLSAVQNLSTAGQSAYAPQVAVDAAGDAVFTWYRWDGAVYRIQTRTRSAGGTLSAVQTLSAAGRNAEMPQVAVDADGDAVFTWQYWDGAVYRVQARTRSAAGTLSAVQNLSAAGRSADTPQVAVNAVGDAVVTWQRSQLIQAAAGP